jgi:hypothetical protein
MWRSLTPTHVVSPVPAIVGHAHVGVSPQRGQLATLKAQPISPAVHDSTGTIDANAGTPIAVGIRSSSDVTSPNHAPAATTALVAGDGTGDLSDSNTNTNPNKVAMAATGSAWQNQNDHQRTASKGALLRAPSQKNKNNNNNGHTHCGTWCRDWRVITLFLSLLAVLAQLTWAVTPVSARDAVYAIEASVYNISICSAGFMLLHSFFKVHAAFDNKLRKVTTWFDILLATFIGVQIISQIVYMIVRAPMTTTSLGDMTIGKRIYTWYTITNYLILVPMFFSTFGLAGFVVGSLRFVLRSATGPPHTWTKVQRSAHRLVQATKAIMGILVAQIIIQVPTLVLADTPTSWFIIYSLNRMLILAIPGIFTLALVPPQQATTHGGSSGIGKDSNSNDNVGSPGGGSGGAIAHNNYVGTTRQVSPSPGLIGRTIGHNGAIIRVASSPPLLSPVTATAAAAAAITSPNDSRRRIYQTNSSHGSHGGQGNGNGNGNGSNGGMRAISPAPITTPLPVPSLVITDVTVAGAVPPSSTALLATVIAS